MCKMSDYPSLYTRAEALVRYKGINATMPGRELLKRAVVIYKVNGIESKEEFLNEVEKGPVVPASEVDLQKKGRRPSEQWMIEAIKSTTDEDVDIIEYVKSMGELL